MNEQALEAQSDGMRQLSLLEKEAQNIATSSLFREEWDRVAHLARTVPSMPVVLRHCMDGAPFSHRHRQVSAVGAVFEDIAVMAAVELEATHPRYLELPSVLVSLADHPLFQAGRAFGRCLYRDLMYFEDEETGEVVFYPVRYEQGEAYEFVDGSIRLPESLLGEQARRLAVAFPLPLRVGRVVGFLSGLAVAQPDEAKNGMVILAGLVAPLLPSALTVPARSPRPGPQRKLLVASGKKREGSVYPRK